LLTNRRLTLLTFGAAIFLSALLLFSLEPLIAKRILPWFGGSAAVWSTCLVFYQVALLAGYLYARVLSRFLSFSLQRLVHGCVLALSLLLLPIGPGAPGSGNASQDPVWLILRTLTLTIGLPFLALSATSPLLQHWLARQGYKTPYQMFAISNFASLAALIAYPFVVEPALDMHAQRWVWSAGFAIFCGVCALAAGSPVKTTWAVEALPARVSISKARGLLWFGLSACGSMLLLSITNHITANVAAVPLLWVLPLSIYLLTFVIAFGSRAGGGRSLWLRVLAVGLGVLGYGIYLIAVVEPIQVSLPIFLFGLFACCMFCHSELNRLKPDATRLTDFYLIVAAGGACGAIFVGIVAPQIFGGIYELPLTLVMTAVLAVVVTWHGGEWAPRLIWIAIAAGMAVVFGANVRGYRENSLSLRRSFYGSLRVVQSRLAGERQTRTLFHGTIEHGAQFLLPPRRLRPTTYYGPDSGIGILLRECFSGPKSMGAVGLGIGTIAAYGQTGDSFRFYEINQQVEDMAQALFFYLRESKAHIEIVMGDGRLSLERERAAPFDVIAVDAFSGDAIPVHLLTREAVALYLRHLKPEGVLAFHVSNNYLDLGSVVKQLADEIHYEAILVRNHENDDDLILPSDWVLVTRNKAVLDNTGLKVHSIAIAPRTGLRTWTDDYNNLLQILKTPQLK
jgi:hypothetical protein